MKKILTAAALTVGMAASASAATIDFTADDLTSGDVDLGGTLVGYNVIGGNGSLSQARHDTNVGCDAAAPWVFACASSVSGDIVDVGFGITGPNDGNNNEVDRQREFVEVRFDELIHVTGFAGMLTYDREDPVPQGPRERVLLQYSSDGGATFNNLDPAEPIFAINEGSGDFDTVGLAYRTDINVAANVVRFRARGAGGEGDNSNIDVTAAGLKVSAVPLPAAAWMLLAGVGGLVAMRRRKKS